MDIFEINFLVSGIINLEELLLFTELRNPRKNQIFPYWKYLEFFLEHYYPEKHMKYSSRDLLNKNIYCLVIEC